jgi:hypothetical protein
MTKLEVSAPLVMGVALACSPAADPSPFEVGGSRDSSGSAADVVGFVDEGAGGPAGSCAGLILEPERLPLDIYFLLDSSGSMAEPSTGTGSKWDLVTGSLVEFLSDAHNEQIGLGLGYFPEDAATDCAANPEACLCIPIINICFANIGGACNADAYAVPSVPVALPSVPQRLIDDIRVRQFAGGTPTRPALEGTYQYLQTWTSQNPGRKVAVVLATDGEPAGCPENQIDDVADLAAAALAGPSRIQTFVIGVGQSLDNLNEIARAGGTTQAFLTDTSSDVSIEFADALESIRAAAAACTFDIPDQTDLGLVDPSLINVRYTESGATEATIVPKTVDGSPSGCGSTLGWHYDNPAAPTRIELCDSTCRAVKGANVEVQFGCESVVAPR